jgi:hypothetical protein
MRVFGAGTLIGKVGTSTPLQFGILQECSIDFNFSLKELFGSYQFPADIGRGTAKIAGKAKQGDIDADIFGNLFFDDTPTVGQLLLVQSEPGVVPAGAPYTITVAGAATFIGDEGVYYAASGQRLQRVSAAVAAGEYIVNEATGVYTFAAADANAAVKITYSKTSTTGGKEIAITSNLLGDAPSFGVLFNGTRNGKQMNISLNRCISSKLTLATKLEDFLIPEFDFSAMADDSGNVGMISITS